MSLNFNHLNASEQVQFGSVTTPLFADGAVTANKLGTAASVIIQDITYTAVNAGASGNSITIQYIEDGIAGLETVVVTGTAIVVNIGNHTVLGSTATQVQTALVASHATSLLITSIITGTPSNIQLAVATTPLVGGITGASGVTSIHADSHPNLVGTVQLVSGSNITLSQSGNAITISNGETPITTGNLTETISSVLTITGGTNAVVGSGTTIDVKQASGSQNGYLSSADWNTFNNKQPSGSYITALTGDATASGPGSTALTLATVNASPGATTLSSVTTNNKGLVTSNTSASTTGFGSVVLAISPTLVTPALGTPSALVLTNATGTPTSITLTNGSGLPLTTGVTGILPVVNGGSGTATPSLVSGTNVTITGTWPNQTVNSTGGGGQSFVPQTITTDITLDTTHAIWLVDTTAGSVNITLPALATADGIFYYIVKISNDSNQASLSPTDGSFSWQNVQNIINQNDSVSIIGSNSASLWLSYNASQFQPLTATTSLQLVTQAFIEFDDAGSNSVSLSAPGTVNTTYDLHLPSDQGAPSTFLQNDGSGTLSWAPATQVIPQVLTAQSPGVLDTGSTPVALGFNLSFTLQKATNGILATVFFGINDSVAGNNLITSLFMDGSDLSSGSYMSQWKVPTIPLGIDLVTISYSWVTYPGDINPHIFEIYGVNETQTGTATFGAQNSMLILQEILS